jgi:hypothetical protein
MQPPLAYFSCGKTAVPFRRNSTLGIRNGHRFRGRCPSARTLARLRIAGRVAAPVARLATGWGGYPFAGRDSHPLDDIPNFMNSSHDSLLSDQNFLVALKRLGSVGQPVVYNAVPPDVYRGFGFPGADDLGNMFQFKAETETAYCGARDLAFCRSLNPELQTFAQWLSRNKSRIPLG